MRYPSFLLMLLSLALPIGISHATPASLPHPVTNEPREEDVRDAIIEKVKAAIAARDFAGLSAMEEGVRLSRARTPSGSWKLAMLHLELQYALGEGLDQANGCQNPQQAFISEWVLAAPCNPAAVITDAAMLEQQAWCFRGSGTADGVSADAWPRFREHVAAAAAVLHAHKAMASVDPEYYAVEMELARDQGMSRDAFRKLLDEAIGKEPDYQETYFHAAPSYLPQWGGSYPDLERFARYAADRSKGIERSGIYARMYLVMDECGCHMTEKSADWSMMKQSMQDVYEQHPTVWNGKNFSKLACRLKDVEEGRRYIRAIHPEAVDEGSFAILFLECDNIAKTGR